MQNFYIAFNAVFPFLSYTAFGACARNAGIVDEPFMNKLNQMVFKLFFPLMMFYNLYSKRDSISLNGRMILVSMGSELALLAILWIVVPLVVKENPRRGVVIQGIFRSNFLLFAVPLSESIFGDEGLTMATIMVACIVPLYNVASVIVLEVFRGGRPTIGSLIKRILQNPLIMGAIAGFIFVGLRIELPTFIEKPVSQFAGMCTPLAMFTLGGLLKPSSVKKNMKCLTIMIALKMVIVPAVMIAFSVLVGLEPVERFVYFTMFATPAAVASYPMAKNMGGDGALAGELVVFSTAVSMFSLFLWILLLKNMMLI